MQDSLSRVSPASSVECGSQEAFPAPSVVALLDSLSDVQGYKPREVRFVLFFCSVFIPPRSASRLPFSLVCYVFIRIVEREGGDAGRLSTSSRPFFVAFQALPHRRCFSSHGNTFHIFSHISAGLGASRVWPARHLPPLSPPLRLPPERRDEGHGRHLPPAGGGAPRRAPPPGGGLDALPGGHREIRGRAQVRPGGKRLLLLYCVLTLYAPL